MDIFFFSSGVDIALGFLEAILAVEGNEVNIYNKVNFLARVNFQRDLKLNPGLNYRNPY